MNKALHALPILDRLNNPKNILLAGAGGGFDIYCGLPLYMALTAAGKKVVLGNLSFTMLSMTDAEWLEDGLWRVEFGHRGGLQLPYYPEKHLCNYLASIGREVSIYAFEKTGVLPLQRVYERLVKDHEIDTIVLVDGGTDSLMGGDEDGLGTPGEDNCSLVAVSKVEVADKLLVCLGFGVDHYHGVCHYQFLENVARLSQVGGYLGCYSLLPSMPGGQAYLDAVRFVNEMMPRHPSVVSNSIASALSGEYGDYHATSRTAGSELWINPLMSIYWGFDLQKVVDSLLYSSFIADTWTFTEILERIDIFREGIKPRPWRDLPI
jgi:hypothetical protein